MTTILDLADIQGGILRAYGRQGFPKARYLFITIRDGAKGRAFIEKLRPHVTTAAPWNNSHRGDPLLRTRNPRVKDIVRAEGMADYPGDAILEKPKVAMNIAFTFSGLLALGVPTRTLRAMPDEFIDGMEARAALLGDDLFLAGRDAIWRRSTGAMRVHLFVSLNAEMNVDGTPVVELEKTTRQLRRWCEESEGGVVLLTGNGPDGADHQELSAILRDSGGRMTPTNKEHFNLSDGFGDPVFSGQLSPEAERLRVIGGGKLLPDRTWAPLATGEFLLGYPDEAQEVPGAAMPIEFNRNGTFMAYRKLHENVALFDEYIADQGMRYARLNGMERNEGEQTVRAKMVGRWQDGVPLMAAPTYADWRRFNAELAAATATHDKPTLARLALAFTDFTYRGDPAGAACPVTSHMRRANPRDMLDPLAATSAPGDGSALVNRRRILRRGLPYGHYDRRAPDSGGEHGIVFLAICTSLFRQFEFVQQQWMQYGLDFNAGSDTCPIIGNHPPEQEPKLVIAADPVGGRRPFICDRLPQFVEPRGGDYFFIPSMTALRLIGTGIIDPT